MQLLLARAVEHRAAACYSYRRAASRQLSSWAARTLMPLVQPLAFSSRAMLVSRDALAEQFIQQRQMRSLVLVSQSDQFHNGGLHIHWALV